MPRSAPALQKAIEYATDLREKAIRANALRLPVVGEIARQAGVSPVTMLRALHLLRDRKLLSLHHGSGITVLTTPASTEVSQPPPPHVPPPKRVWERLQYKLSTEIRDGRYAPGELLPSAKELVAVYGTSHATLRRALSALCDQDQIVPWGRKYRVTEQSAPSPSSSLVLIARGDERGQLTVLSPRVEEHLRTLERECARARVRLLVYTSIPGDPGLYQPGGLRLSPEQIVRTPFVLGFHLWVIGMSSEEVRYAAYWASLSGKPVAILHEHDRFDALTTTPARIHTRVFRLASNVRAGEQAGTYLRSLGHRDIAYISPVHGSSWSQERLDGIRGVCGGAVQVPGFTIDKNGQNEFVTTQATNVAEATRRQLRAVFGGGQLPLTYTPHVGTRTLEAAIEHDAMGAAIEPILEQALTRHSVTAWVAASDSIALLCLNFLVRRRIEVPAALSVLGFDDSLDAFLLRLTSYNFNGSATVRAMLSYVLRKDFRHKAESSAPVDFDGFISERSTTGRMAG